jgi:uncharacterized protein (UPF0332 family)
MKAEEIRALVKYRLEQAVISIEDAKALISLERIPMSIVNRSYYAMFYAPSALLQTISKASPKHAGVLSLFDQEFVLTGLFPREMGRAFHDAFNLRLRSDYRIVPIPDQARVVEVWEKAVKFVDAARQYLSQKEYI